LPTQAEAYHGIHTHRIGRVASLNSQRRTRPETRLANLDGAAPDALRALLLHLAVLADSDPTPPANQHAATLWFVLTLSYIALSVPVAFFWRGHLFKGYWSGQRVPPREYLIGMISIWLALSIGGLASVAGCIATRSMVPNMLPAVLAFVVYISLWPNGHSMSRPLHDEHDPLDYEDPR